MLLSLQGQSSVFVNYKSLFTLHFHRCTVKLHFFTVQLSPVHFHFIFQRNLLFFMIRVVLKSDNNPPPAREDSLQWCLRQWAPPPGSWGPLWCAGCGHASRCQQTPALTWGHAGRSHSGTGWTAAHHKVLMENEIGWFNFVLNNLFLKQIIC